MDPETLPLDIALIAKLNGIYANERDQYSLLCNEDDFLAIYKVSYNFIWFIYL